MTDKQPEALSIAKRLKNQQQPLSLALREKAAAELRRLHEVNAELVEVLKYVRAAIPHERWADDTKRMVDAAIAKATGENND